MIDWHAFILPPRPVPDTMARMARLMYRAEERGSVEEFGRFYDAWDASYFTAAARAISRRPPSRT